MQESHAIIPRFCSLTSPFPVTLYLLFINVITSFRTVSHFAIWKEAAARRRHLSTERLPPLVLGLFRLTIRGTCRDGKKGEKVRLLLLF
jgi:hypothetical protein